MAEVFLIMRRTDIPDGVLQVVDLWPNTSSKNYIYPPGLGQTGYIHNIPDAAADGSVGAGPTFTVSADVTGVSAYLLGNIDTGAGAGGAPFTGAEADAATAALVAIANAGTVLDAAAVDAALGAVVAGTSLSGGGSTGVLTELLSVMAGAGYQVDAGTDLAAGGVKVAAQQGAFVEGVYKQLYDIGHFLCSNLNGNISLMKSANFDYDGTTGAAVTVYSATGTLL
jgi:hypothetical protein